MRHSLLLAVAAVLICPLGPVAFGADVTGVDVPWWMQSAWYPAGQVATSSRAARGSRPVERPASGVSESLASELVRGSIEPSSNSNRDVDEALLLPAGVSVDLRQGMPVQSQRSTPVRTEPVARPGTTTTTQVPTQVVLTTPVGAPVGSNISRPVRPGPPRSQEPPPVQPDPAPADPVVKPPAPNPVVPPDRPVVPPFEPPPNPVVVNPPVQPPVVRNNRQPVAANPNNGQNNGQGRTSRLRTESYMESRRRAQAGVSSNRRSLGNLEVNDPRARPAAVGPVPRSPVQNTRSSMGNYQPPLGPNIAGGGASGVPVQQAGTSYPQASGPAPRVVFPEAPARRSMGNRVPASAPSSIAPAKSGPRRRSMGNLGP